MTGAEKIARGLTKAQAFALVRHREIYGTHNRGWPEPARDPTSFCFTGRELMDLKLIRWAGPQSSATRLTDLGRVVRAIIEEATRHD